MRFAVTLLLLVVNLPALGGSLSDNIRISSESLGYDLQYRIYIPDGAEALQDLPVLFVTDGPGYINRGRMTGVLNRQIEAGKIDPVVVVFVDARNPDNLRQNRRNAEFLCNKDYLHFYQRELIPAIEDKYPVGRSREHRGILGLSFGATNAACFAIRGHETFYLIGMQSPANHPIEGLLPAFEQAPMLPLRMFLSTGTPNDNTRANRQFRDVLEKKGYDMQYVEVRQDHNWDNWGPLLDDVLRYFYGRGD